MCFRSLSDLNKEVSPPRLGEYYRESPRECCSSSALLQGTNENP